MKPIIFSTPMVRAILDGRKTQTRRIFKPTRKMLKAICDEWMSRPGTIYPPDEIDYYNLLGMCPYGNEGDILYVRETWAEMCKEALPYCECETEEEVAKYHYYEYRADNPRAKYPGGWDDAFPEELTADYIPKWKPSIHMPRKAARLFLKILDVKLEPVTNISQEDVRKEGFDSLDGFIKLWNELYTHRMAGWDMYPEVWVIDFEVLLGNQLARNHPLGYVLAQIPGGNQGIDPQG